MPLELLLEGGLLLAAVVTAFSISFIVGMLIAHLRAIPHPFGGWLDDADVWPALPNHVENVSVRRSPAQSLPR